MLSFPPAAKRLTALSAFAACAVWAAMGSWGAAHADAQSLQQSDWSGGGGGAASGNLSGETAFDTLSGQWAFGTSGALTASSVVFRAGAGAPSYSLLSVESAGSARDYVGFGGCGLSLTAPAPACRELQLFLHRDTLSGIQSLVSLTDGSGLSGCAGSWSGAFTASPGVALAHSEGALAVQLSGGVGNIAHMWSGGCAEGAVLTLPTQFAISDGALTRRMNLERMAVLLQPQSAAELEVALDSLPNDGQAGAPVPFELAGGLSGSLTSVVFDLGERRGLTRLELDAQVEGATLEVYVRTGNSSANVGTRPWEGPFSDGQDLSAAGLNNQRFVQYRVDVTLDDVSATPGASQPFVSLMEIRFDLSGRCDCEFGGRCYADGERNPANACEACDIATTSSAFTYLGDGASCDDGLFCTSADSCQAGLCTGPSPCSDGLACTDDDCDEGLDACTFPVTSGCAIQGMCVAAATANPLDACELCDPTLPTQWTLAPGCAGCNTSADCPESSAPLCDVSDHACVACLPSDSTSCGELRPVCDDSTRSCRGCDQDAECLAPGRPFCGPSGTCVACTEHEQCDASAPVCTGGDCLGCVTNAECLDRNPTTPLCSPSTGTCGSCLEASECNGAVAGTSCVPSSDGNRCGCTQEAHCGVGFTCSPERRVCLPLATADSDRDGVPDDKDADDDNDGIPDLVEGGGADYSLDLDRDGIPNWRDSDVVGFEDVNGDGTDDRADFDLDGVPNQLDLDADNDGVPDSLENAGRDVLDRDRDGRLDDTVDLDRDGLVATADSDDADPDLSASVVPLRDTDGDSVPDYLDRDSDAEGEDDTLEAGGRDADGDGRVDGFRDANQNGLSDALDVLAGGAALPLPDRDGDGVWDFQDDSDAARITVTGGALCAAGSPARDGNGAWCFGLGVLALLWRRRS